MLLMGMIFAVTALAQDEPMNPDYSTYYQGSKKISIGAGFPNVSHEAIEIAGNILGTNADNGTSTPMFMGMFEYGLTENISLGAYGGYFKSESAAISAGSQLISLFTGGGQNLADIGSAEFSVISIGGKLGVHYPLINKLDTYVSTYAGYNIVNDDINVNAPSTGSSIGDAAVRLLINEGIGNLNYPTFTYEANAGAKYYFNENIGIYGEAGIGRFLVNAGLTVNL